MTKTIYNFDPNPEIDFPRFASTTGKTTQDLINENTEKIAKSLASIADSLKAIKEHLCNKEA